MRSGHDYDAVVVGAGPNGLSAAVTLARAGAAVLLVEAADRIGGGARSEALTLPGFVHDRCSAIHPLGAALGLFDRLGLDRHGLEWIDPPVLLAHPLGGDRAAALYRDIDRTADGLGPDGDAWRRLLGPAVGAWDDIAAHLMDPLRLPRAPLRLAAAGIMALAPARGLAWRMLRTDAGRALYAGSAGHSFRALEEPATAAFGMLLLAAGHVAGWPLARGGSQAIADALAAQLVDLGGEIETGWAVRDIDELPRAGATLLDVTPRQLAQIAGHRFPAAYRRKLEGFGYGEAAFKVDYALSGPVPWTAPECRQAGTVHLGGPPEAVTASARAVAAGHHPDEPFVIVAQPSLFDASRAPAGAQTLWAYCHVPHGSTVDMTDRIEAQIERFAPGFRDLVLHRRSSGPAALEAYNANLVGGDISGGNHRLPTMLFGPTLRPAPHSTPAPDVLLCSSSTPPGPGVHGLCGYHAARAALRGPLAASLRRAT